MMDALALPFFRNAALAALVLAGIHAYLGYHVVRRGVLFVDLALAQMAALGVALGVVLGREHDEVGSYLLALGMTFVGAALFAWLRGRSRAVPLEAYIGIVFATAQALVFLVLEKSPSGPEHLKETLVGSLFTVDPAHIARVAALYALVGAVHFFLRKPFFEITHDAEGAARRGRRVFLWDFLFYATFGLVVTSFVRIAGVYLVFSYLIVPAVCGALLSSRIAVRLAIGWGVALSAGVAGLLLSTQWESMDLPTGPTIVCIFGLLLAASGAVAYLQHRRERAAGRDEGTHI